MSVLQGAIVVGKETAYGTAPAALNRGYEAKNDSWKRQTEYLESVGFRPGMQTVRADRRRPVHKGGTGEIELDLLTSGAGLLLASIFTTATATDVEAPGQPGAKVATKWTFGVAVDESPLSLTVQAQRPKVSGGIVPFTHLGCVVTEASFTQEVDQNLLVKAGFDFQDVKLDVPAGTPTYPATAVPFAWSECEIKLKVAGSDVVFEPSKFELNANFGMKADRYRLINGGRKTRPFRSQVPTYEGSLEIDFDSTDIYRAYVEGTPCELTATWSGPQIASGVHSQFALRIPVIQFSGESPEMSLEDLTKQPLPFRVLDPGTGTPAVSATYVTTDAEL
ncbi:phage tail tube protein [Crossiella sp. CA198]|uniref:phage tail tube protein n=1 Tax=Crossiella sp. CA198 TaxID=3455607 RepID=UPI003F8D0D4C